MQMLETDWWTIELPPEWDAEQDDEVVVIEDEDGVSCIEISSLVREDGAVSDADLAGFSLELREEGHASRPVSVGTWRGEFFVYDDEEHHWREWFLRQGGHFVYIAYHCLLEHKSMDDAAVDEILATLEPRNAA